MQYSPLLITIFCLIVVMPLQAQVAGFSGADDDRDGLPDDFEQAILEKFRPVWRISSTDCDVLPAEFLSGVTTPTVKDRNGTIYGQVFIRGTSSLGFFVEAHFYDLWAADCGYINSHALDAEHVSVLVRATDPSRPLSQWYASQWYAAAHEDTLCDSSQFASAAIINAEDKGATFWVARGKHGAFFSQQVCSIGGCGLDRCDTSTNILERTPINIGEPGAPLNGAVWTTSGNWPMLDKMRSDFPTFATFSSLSYALAEDGGFAVSTTGAPNSTIVGYASAESSDGGSAPSGVSIFTYRRNNVLVTEAGVPSSPLIQSGRIYAEVAGPARTGLALVNPGAEPAQVSFFFTDENGRDFGFGGVNIPARGLIGRFLNESPFNSGPVRGSFTFTSSVPLSVVALRGFTNERGEFLITTLPVSPLAASAMPIVFPQIADGGGWTTRIVLVNPTDTVMTGIVRFWQQGTTSSSAPPLEVALNGVTGSSFEYRIAPRSSWLGTTAGLSAGARVGSAQVSPASGSGVPSGATVFSFRRNGIVVTESGAPATSAGSAFQLYAESSGNFTAQAPGSLQTGIAIANLQDTPATLTLELTTLTGSSVTVTRDMTLPGKGQRAMFLSELPGFSGLPPDFHGFLRVSSSASNAIAVVGLRGRYNERRDFLLATTPAINEGTVSFDSRMLFPYIAEGGGYTTQFILSDPPSALGSSGWLRFYSQNGVPLNLSLR